MAFQFELKDFNGPLDLLLHLIGDAKIDIKDIFVSQVTDQYIKIVQESPQLDMEEASEFIQMAATLLLIKSRSILPPTPNEGDEEEENPEEVLIRQLEEYAKFQQLASQMQDFEQAAARLFSKLPDEFPLPPPVYELEGLTLDGLIAAFLRISERIKDKSEENGSIPSQIIQMDRHTVGDCMKTILRLTKKGGVGFTGLFSANPSRNEVVTLFLALLELLKQGRIAARQESPDAEIQILRHDRKEETVHAE